MLLKFRLKKKMKRYFCFEEVVEGFDNYVVGTLNIQRSAFVSVPEEVEVILSGKELKDESGD